MYNLFLHEQWVFWYYSKCKRKATLVSTGETARSQSTQHRRNLNKMSESAGAACSEEREIQTIEPEQHATIHEDLKNLSNFKVDKVLFNNSQRKTICLQGNFGDERVGILVLEKTAFDDEKLLDSRYFFNDENDLKKLFHNDIYGNYEFFPQIEQNAIKVTIIHPATDKHIEKYSTHTVHLVNETPEIYQSIILPYCTEEQLKLQWVYNILEHKSEVERIIFDDPDEKTGFVLLPDLKWDGKTLQTLYLLAIVRDRNIKSLRDLKGDHLNLLRNIQNNGVKTIKEKYNLDESRLRIYVHYHPSFYHFHVHFTYLQYDAPGIFAERSHILSSVINNIELLPDYYQKATLPFTVHENVSLFKKLTEKGVITKCD